jgi:hypothetical protein
MTSTLFYTGPSVETLRTEYAAYGKIDEAAPITNTSSVIIDAPVQRVWAALIDIRSWETWYIGFKLQELNEITPSAAFRWKLSGMAFKSTFAVVEEGRELSWTGRFLVYNAIDRHLIEPVDGDRTRVTMAESLAGPLLTLFYNQAKLRTDHEEFLTSFKAHLEQAG